MPNHTYSNPFVQSEVNDLVRDAVLSFRPTAPICILDLFVVCPPLKDVSPQRITIALSHVATPLEKKDVHTRTYYVRKKEVEV